MGNCIIRECLIIYFPGDPNNNNNNNNNNNIVLLKAESISKESFYLLVTILKVSHFLKC